MATIINSLEKLGSWFYSHNEQNDLIKKAYLPNNLSRTAHFSESKYHQTRKKTFINIIL